MKQTKPFRIPNSLSPRLSPKAFLHAHRKCIFPIVVPKRQYLLGINKYFALANQMEKSIAIRHHQFSDSKRNEFSEFVSERPKQAEKLRAHTESNKPKISENKSFSFKKPKHSRLSSQQRVINWQQVQNKLSQRYEVESHPQAKDQLVTFYPKIKVRQPK